MILYFIVFIELFRVFSSRSVSFETKNIQVFQGLRYDEALFLWSL